MDLLECIGCEEQVVILLLQHIYHYIALLWIVLADAFEFLGQQASHFWHVYVLGQVVRDII